MYIYLCLSAYATSSLHHFNQPTCWNLPSNINHSTNEFLHFHCVSFSVCFFWVCVSNSLIYDFWLMIFIQHFCVRLDRMYHEMGSSEHDCLQKIDAILLKTSKSLHDAIVQWIFATKLFLFPFHSFLFRWTIDAIFLFKSIFSHKFQIGTNWIPTFTHRTPQRDIQNVERWLSATHFLAISLHENI